MTPPCALLVTCPGVGWLSCLRFVGGCLLLLACCLTALYFLRDNSRRCLLGVLCFCYVCVKFCKLTSGRWWFPASAPDRSGASSVRQSRLELVLLTLAHSEWSKVVVLVGFRYSWCCWLGSAVQWRGSRPEFFLVWGRLACRSPALYCPHSRFSTAKNEPSCCPGAQVF